MSQKNKTIEEKMADLRQLTAWFESEEFSIESAAEKYKAAKALATEIEHDLEELKNEISVVANASEL